MVASKALGGAERWFIRFSAALAEQGAPTQLAIRGGSELERLDGGPLPLHRLPFRTVWDPVSRSAVARLIRELEPDIVQTYMGRATRLTRLPPGRGPVHIARLGGYYKLSAYRHAHAWIGNTKGVCDYLIHNGLPASRVFHIYNFIDPPAPLPAERVAAVRSGLGVPDDAWLLLTPGRFVPVKGHRYLIDALARLPERIGGRPLRLVLLGDGALGARLETQARQLGVAERVVWAGWQEEPAPFFELADLVVFPSLELETFGNVILEAWAHHRPLLTSLFRGAREIARPGEDALCVPCADPAALARGVQTLLGDAALRRALATSGQERVRRDFGRVPIVRQYLDLYQRLGAAR
jgi:glycosyltransferase involved in cell wall biosynthesis